MGTSTHNWLVDFGKHKQWFRDTMTAAIENGLPIFVTEYGICDASGSGSIDETEAIHRLRYEKPNLQICFRSQKALEGLHFERSQIV